MSQSKPAEYFARLRPRQRHSDPRSRPLAQYLALFLAEKQADNLSPGYLGELERTLRRFIVFLEDALAREPILEDFTVDAARAFELYERDRVKWEHHPAQSLRLHARPVTAQTVQNVVRMLKVFAGWLDREEYSLDEQGKPQNILARFRLPKVEKKEIVPLTPKEEAQLARACDDRTRDGCRRLAILLLFLDSGARREEIAGLAIRDIDFDRGQMYIRWQSAKGRKERIVSFGSKTERALRKYGLLFRDPPISESDPDDRFFLNPNGEPITGSGIYQMIKRMARRTGIEQLYPHLLRHTNATRELERGKSTREIQVKLGHSSVTTTERYIHVVERERSNRKRDSHVDDLPIAVKRGTRARGQGAAPPR